MIRNAVFFLIAICGSSFVSAGTLGFSALLNDWHTVLFLVVNLFLTYYFAIHRFDRFAAVHGAEVLTTVGIFGCFVGIALALLEFDASDVQASIPKLLDGVKTAFWASVSGVGGALAVRARHKFQKTPLVEAEGAPKSSSLDDVVLALNAVKQSLSGSDDESLISQIKLMRQDQNDNQKSLKISFDEFAKKIAEDGSKALVEALRAVIADFNAKINEQFGENFKHLNAAVEKLVVWQVQYKTELDRLQDVQATTAKDLSDSAARLGEVAKSSEKFTEAASKLTTLLTALRTQHEQIKNSQADLANVLANLRNVAPEFAKNIEMLIEQINTGVKKVQDQMLVTATNFTNSSKTTSEGLAKELGQSLAGFSDQSRAAVEKLTGQLSENLQKSQSKLDAQMDANLEKIKSAASSLDESLQNELNRSLQALGNQLASLSKRFVEDYAPLTDKLREVVRLTENLDQKNAS